MYFRRNLSQSVETISVTSNFDGYSESKYTKKGRQNAGDLFLVSFVFSLFSEFLCEPLVECHVGTDFLLVLRLGKCQYVAR